MNPSGPFIRRPVATTLLMLAVLLSGLLAYGLLPRSALPQVDYPTIQVSTRYPGASPEVMASVVTAPLERQFGSIAGLQQMSSTSSGGLSLVTLQFGLDIRLDIAEQSVQAAINAASGHLPRDLPFPPVYSKVNPADAPVLTLAVHSRTLPLQRVQDLVDTRLVQSLSQVTGVGLVTLSGGQRPAVRIRADLRRLASYGLGLEQIQAAVQAGNSHQAKGGFDGTERAATLETNGQLGSAEDYRRLVVAHRAGVPVRLRDVAEVTEAAEDAFLAAWSDDRPAILLHVQRQPGANVIAVVDRIHALMPQLRQALPAAVELDVLADRTATVRASVRSMQHELLLAISLVIMVIFLFLRTLAGTLIPSLAVPLSLVGTFGVMHLAGFSLNNLTLMALTIATGFVVDDAIVMIENIARHIEAGKKPLQAAFDGSRQIAFTIISLTFSLIAVLIPLLFMGDLVGRLFREFALTLAIAILISAVVSLTLTPMLCARLLRAPRREGRLFSRLVEAYDRSLRLVLNRQAATLGVAAAVGVLTVVLAWWVPKGFFPQQDTGLLLGIAQAPASTSFAAMSQRQQALAGVLLSDPDVAGVSTVVGIDGSNTTLHTARLMVSLRPHGQRRDDASLIARRLQAAATVPGLALHLQPVQDLTVDDRVGAGQYRLLLDGTDAGDLAEWTPRVLDALRGLPELAHAASNFQTDGLQLFVDVDRDGAARLGLTMAAIDEALHSAFGQRFVSTIFTPSNQYRVILEAGHGLPSGPAALSQLHVTSASGRPVPLSSVAQIRQVPAAPALHRESQFPAATLSFDVAPGRALGDAVAAIESAVDALALPPGLNARFQGAARAFGDALEHELWLVIAALVTMYIVLGILYESFWHPLTVLSTLPSAGVGALLALMATRTDLSVIAIIGIVLLIGIVQKNAIMIIDFALEAQRDHGRPAREAVHQACLLRLRPILMTTLAALLSAVPLALGTGAGSEMRQPLGIVLIGGLLLSQLLTLYTTPVVYLAVDRLARPGRAASAAAVTTEAAA